MNLNNKQNFKRYLKQINTTTKIKFISLIIILTTLLNCKTSNIKNSPIAETGMYKVTILYPNGDDKNFDMDYYENKHMPMMARFLGKNLKYYEIDKGLSGRTSSDKVPFVAIGYFYIYDVAEYNKSIAQNRDAVVSDIENYTNIQSVIHFSEFRKVDFNKVK